MQAQTKGARKICSGKGQGDPMGGRLRSPRDPGSPAHQKRGKNIIGSCHGKLKGIGKRQPEGRYDGNKRGGGG